MKLKIKDLLRIIPEFNRFEKSPINHNSNTIGYNINLIQNDGSVAGGGFHAHSDQALLKALCESYERKFVTQICNTSNDYGVNFDPTTSGFAFGFDENKVRLRSLAEALERWAWSKWIDDGYFFAPSKMESSDLVDFFNSHFIDVRLFEKKFKLITQDLNVEFRVLIYLGLTDKGVFPGTRTTLTDDGHALEHAAMEAWRHLIISQDKTKYIRPRENIFYERVKYFSQNKELALKIIENATNDLWPLPKIRMCTRLKEVELPFVGYRSLIDGYRPWNLDGKQRFVY